MSHDNSYKPKKGALSKSGAGQLRILLLTAINSTAQSNQTVNLGIQFKFATKKPLKVTFSRL